MKYPGPAIERLYRKPSAPGLVKVTDSRNFTVGQRVAFFLEGESPAMKRRRERFEAVMRVLRKEPDAWEKALRAADAVGPEL